MKGMALRVGRKSYTSMQTRFHDRHKLVTKLHDSNSSYDLSHHLCNPKIILLKIVFKLINQLSRLEKSP